ncbi:hypothetical protein CEP52_007038 [Fusarium oligoseptatum]|uniref:Uncharacterized protein n=1 Tax=Fusarium oligoseptatum TaxID=2604345 RepID=A0A428TPU7_9HYPO|nr:hypothetical protein CEP52_007038 [Fusarium oligoseptatum]
MHALGLGLDVEDDLNQDNTKLTTTSTDSQQDSSNGAVPEETSAVQKKQKGDTTAKGDPDSKKPSSQPAMPVQDDQFGLTPPLASVRSV